MMALLREWLFSLVTVTVLLSLVQLLIPEGSLRRIAGFIGGLLLLVTLLQPLLRVDADQLDWDLRGYAQAVEQRKAELEQERQEQLAGLIAERTQAYILDKAASLGLSPQVWVQTQQGAEGIPIPFSVQLDIPQSPALAAYMERELGIPKERQVWSET